MARNYQAPYLEEEELDEHSLELQNRMKNLLWTVSGDYKLEVKLDLDSFKKSPYITIYDAVKQGAFAKYYNMEELSMYIVKKIYLSGSQAPLMEIAQLCVDEASYPLITKSVPVWRRSGAGLFGIFWNFSPPG